MAHWDKVLCLVALVKDETAIKRFSTTPFHQLVQSAGVATFGQPGRQTHTTLWYSGRQTFSGVKTTSICKIIYCRWSTLETCHYQCFALWQVIRASKCLPLWTLLTRVAYVENTMPSLNSEDKPNALQSKMRNHSDEEYIQHICTYRPIVTIEYLCTFKSTL